mgnify:CR=1 FL=1
MTRPIPAILQQITLGVTMLSFGAVTIAQEPFVPTRPETLSWGWFPLDKTPVLTIASGDTVRIDTLSHAGATQDEHPEASLGDLGVEPHEILSDVIDFWATRNQRPRDGRSGHIITGPIALEGALKLKEISYIHAEAYPAGEMKHGPIALIDRDMPVVAIVTQTRWYDKMISQLQQARARGAPIVAVATDGDQRIEALADHVLWVPDCSWMLSPVLTTIPLQLLAYHIAVLRGCDVDQPRNLAKSVTVE